MNRPRWRLAVTIILWITSLKFSLSTLTPFDSETVRKFVRSRCNGGGFFYRNGRKRGTPLFREGGEGCAIWVYEGALVDPSNGRTIAQVEGLEIVRHLTECYNTKHVTQGNESQPSDTAQLQAWTSFRGLKRLGDLTVKNTLVDKHNNHWDYATTILSRKLFCYMAPPQDRDEKDNTSSANVDDTSRQLLTHFRMRPASPVRHIPIQQASALYDTATTFISCNQGRDLYVHSEFPDGRWCVGSATGPGGNKAGNFDFQIYVRGNSPKDKLSLGHGNTNLFTTTHPTDGLQNMFTSLSNTIQKPWKKKLNTSSSSNPIVISPPRSKFFQFGRDSFLDQLKRYGSSRETYSYTMNHPNIVNERNTQRNRLLDRLLQHSIENLTHLIDYAVINPVNRLGERIGLWDFTNPIMTPCQATRNSLAPNDDLDTIAPFCTLRYTRYGESPPWYGIGRMCTLELMGYKISSLDEVPPLVARIAATQVPGFMSVNAPIPNAPIVVEASSKKAGSPKSLCPSSIQQQMDADEGATRAITWFRGKENGSMSIPLRIVGAT